TKAVPGNLPGNLLVITIDTLRADGLGCYGGAAVRTPWLDALARDSWQITQAYAAVPITNPSHCSIFTGLNPANHGAVNFGFRLRENAPCLPGSLRDKGCATAAFISGFSLVARISGLERHFDVYDDQWGGSARLTDRPADATTDNALRWLDCIDGPFALWVHFFDPHKPYEPPVNYGRMYQKEYTGPAAPAAMTLLRAQNDPGPHPVEPLAALDRHGAGQGQVTAAELEENINLYRGEISFADAQVGRIMVYLAGKDLLDSTVIVVTSDHGESFGHGYYFRHIDRVYDSLLHVPMLIKVPGEAAGLVAGDMPHIDLAPTIARLMGIDTYLADGDARVDELRHGRLAPGRALFAQTAGRDVDWSRGDIASVRQDDWKLITYVDRGEAELFDLRTDPGELDNRVERDMVMARRMEDLIEDWTIDHNAATPVGMVLDAPDQERLRALGYLQ
ncbi:sulfatase, partial [bacterium]|nr:sulfatase [candidate division CSSED10-310 bacterium]